MNFVDIDDLGLRVDDIFCVRWYNINNVPPELCEAAVGSLSEQRATLRSVLLYPDVIQ